jgi:hypothetical protein
MRLHSVNSIFALERVKASTALPLDEHGSKIGSREETVG